MRTAPRLVAGTLAALALVAACSSDDDDTMPTPTPSADALSPSEPAPESPSQSPSPSVAPSKTLHRQPLAFAISQHRPALALSTATARRLLAGHPTRWFDLGQEGGPVRVLRGPGAIRAAAFDPAVLAVVPAGELRPIVQPVTVDGVDPLRAPRRYPLKTVSGWPFDPAITTVTFVGDIMLDRGVAAAHPGDPGAPLRPLSKRLRSADLTVGNLESTLSDDGTPRQPGDDSFAADPAVVPALAAAGFDLLSLANNHTGDYGPAAFRQTLQRIDRSPIRRVGAGDASEAWRPVVLERGGITFGFVAFNTIGETPRPTADRLGAAEVRMPPRTGPLNRADLRRLTDTIADLTDRVDVVIAQPHWGHNYTNVPVPAQRRVGAAMLDAGADLVVGGHPHWVQGIQTHQGRLVIHSLGNFVFDMDFMTETEEGVLLELVWWGPDLMGARFVPYVIGDDFVPRLASGPRADAALDRMWAASDPPFRD